MTPATGIAVDGRRTVLGDIKVPNGRHHEIRANWPSSPGIGCRHRLTLQLIHGSTHVVLRNAVFQECPFVSLVLSEPPLTFAQNIPVYDLTCALESLGVTPDALVCAAAYLEARCSSSDAAAGPAHGLPPTKPKVNKAAAAKKYAELSRTCQPLALLEAAAFFDIRELRVFAVERLHAELKPMDAVRTLRSLSRRISTVHYAELTRAVKYCKQVVLFHVRNIETRALLALPTDVLRDVVTSRALCVQNESQRFELVRVLYHLADEISAGTRLRMLGRLLRCGIAQQHPESLRYENQSGSDGETPLEAPPLRVMATFDPRHSRPQVLYLRHNRRELQLECVFEREPQCTQPSSPTPAQLRLTLGLACGPPAQIHAEIRPLSGPTCIVQGYVTIAREFKTGETFTVPTTVEIPAGARIVKIPLVVYVL